MGISGRLNVNVWLFGLFGLKLKKIRYDYFLRLKDEGILRIYGYLGRLKK